MSYNKKRKMLVAPSLDDSTVYVRFYPDEVVGLAQYDLLRGKKRTFNPFCYEVITGTQVLLKGGHSVYTAWGVTYTQCVLEEAT